jgi:hypothetical protein
LKHRLPQTSASSGAGRIGKPLRGFLRQDKQDSIYIFFITFRGKSDGIQPACGGIVTKTSIPKKIDRSEFYYVKRKEIDIFCLHVVLLFLSFLVRVQEMLTVHAVKIFCEMNLEVVSKPQIRFKGKAQADRESAAYMGM